MSATLQDTPCWIADCDDCGEAFGYEEYSHMHCSTVEELRESATDCDWTIDGEKWFCTACSERRTCVTNGHRPDEGGYCARCEELVVACVVTNPNPGGVP